MSCTNHRGSALAEIIAVGNQPPAARRQFVEDLFDAIADGQVDERAALLLIDLAGLAGDRDTLVDGVEQRQLRDGLRDGTVDPRHVDPDLRVGRDEAVSQLSADAAVAYARCVRRLAMTRGEFEERFDVLRGVTTEVGDVVMGGAR